MQIENAQGQRVSISAGGMFLITPDDNVEFVAKGIRIENVADGNTLRLMMEDDSIITLTLKAFEHGEKPYNVKRVYATGTSGTLKIFGLK